MNRLLCLVLVLTLAACAPTDNEPATPPTLQSTTGNADAQGAKWIVTEGMESPESAYVDPVSGSIFVSQVTGEANGRDGTGRIAKLGPNGEVISTSWVTGLNAPKGLRSHENTLWTADIDEVIGINMADGQITSRVKVDGAQFLNDVAVGDDGTVYVSDMMLSRIHAVKDGKASVFSEGDDIEYPNGLLVENGRLIVAAWGKPEADFSTKVPGRLFALDLKTKQKTLITPEPIGNLDGLESDGQGGYIVTDWNAGKVLHVMADGTVHPLKEFMPGTADLAFLPAQNLLIVPHMNENKVAAYELPN